MEFHGTRAAHSNDTGFHAIPWNIPWNSMELGGYQFNWQQDPMEFHAISCGITWDSGVTKSITAMFYGIPWNMEITILNDVSVLWDYRNSSIISVEIMCRQIKYEQSQSSMKFNGSWFNFWFGNLSVPWNKRVPFLMARVFMETPWNIQWNSVELLCRRIKYHRVPWNSMEL